MFDKIWEEEGSVVQNMQASPSAIALSASVVSYVTIQNIVRLWAGTLFYAFIPHSQSDITHHCGKSEDSIRLSNLVGVVLDIRMCLIHLYSQICLYKI